MVVSRKVTENYYQCYKWNDPHFPFLSDGEGGTAYIVAGAGLVKSKRWDILIVRDKNVPFPDCYVSSELSCYGSGIGIHSWKLLLLQCERYCGSLVCHGQSGPTDFIKALLLLKMKTEDAVCGYR